MIKNLITLWTISLLFVPISNAHANLLRIKGSDTLINLVQRISEEYMVVEPNEYVAVTGGGSGTGIASLLNHKCDIANSSRMMKQHEFSLAKKTAIEPQRVIIAMDGLSIITHPDNPVNQLTLIQLGGIYRGDIKNWKEVGGANLPITLYGRQSNSGTFIYIQDKVLKSDYSQKMNRMNGNAQIVESIKRDKSGIGYVGIGYVRNNPAIKTIALAREGDLNYISPLSQEDIDNERYPLIRPLFQYINGSPSPAVRKLISFELSDKGQSIVQEEGFIPVPPKYQQLNAQLGF